FDPGAGTSNLISGGSLQIFVSKLDNSGNFGWAKHLGGPGNNIGYSIATDASGNVYTSGHFSMTVDFDPGAGIQNFISAGAGDVFVSKLDASGNFVWAKQMGNTANDVSTCIAIDASGYVYTSGYFFDTVDFDPGAGISNLTTNGVGDIFVSKLDSSGNFVWARNMGSTLDDFTHALALDSAGGVYTTGFYAGSADFDPGAGTYYLHSYFPADSSLIRDQIFVSKLDSSGTFAWAVQLGGVKGYGIAATSSYVYSTGFFTATADFDPTATVFNLTTAGSDDVYVHKLNQSSLGTNESYSTSFELYPNPATDNFTIRTNTVADEILITDLLGNEVMNLQPVSAETTVNMGNCANGVYLVKVISGNSQSVSRLVLSK
ncbi:MAG TPA: T9SS type A sorting domain-containing protein, partial [Bacteroidia bacterium]|nr:T9SS type A sorting domain-containing protein [Bacteroidia bacterium]